MKLLAVVNLYLMLFISVDWLIIRAIALFNLIEVRVVMIDDDIVITIRVDEIFEVDVALIFRLGRGFSWFWFLFWRSGRGREGVRDPPISGSAFARARVAPPAHLPRPGAAPGYVPRGAERCPGCPELPFDSVPHGTVVVY